jgi:hypothetical protein
MAAHCSADMAPVPESVSRSIGTSSAATPNKLYPAASRALARSARVVSRIGSTEWIRNGSMIVRNGFSLVIRAPQLLAWADRPRRVEAFLEDRSGRQHFLSPSVQTPAATARVARPAGWLAADALITRPCDPRLAIQVEDDRQPPVRQLQEDAA